jgi:hypothetical protein
LLGDLFRAKNAGVTTGSSSSSRTHKIADPPAQPKRRQRTPVATPIKITDPGHSAWGPRLFHCLTLLHQGLRYLNPLREQCFRPAVTEVTTALCTPTQDSSTHGSSAPCRQHKDQAHPLSCCTRANQPPIILPQAESSLHKWRLQGGRDADEAAVARPATRLGFHPETLCSRTRRPIVMPPTGRTTPPLPPTRVLVKAFAQTTPHLEHLRLAAACKLPTASATLLPER